MGDGNYRLGCDIGGTFTDFVLVNDETGEFQINKCLTTPGDPSDAVEQGILELLERTSGFMPKIEEIIHGTTLVINAIIERKGAKTGLITTRGFRDETLSRQDCGNYRGRGFDNKRCDIGTVHPAFDNQPMGHGGRLFGKEREARPGHVQGDGRA